MHLLIHHVQNRSYYKPFISLPFSIINHVQLNIASMIFSHQYVFYVTFSLKLYSPEHINTALPSIYTSSSFIVISNCPPERQQQLDCWLTRFCKQHKQQNKRLFHKQGYDPHLFPRCRLSYVLY